MKRKIVMLFVVIMCMALCACGSGNAGGNGSTENSENAGNSNTDKNEAVNINPEYVGTWGKLGTLAVSGDGTSTYGDYILILNAVGTGRQLRGDTDEQITWWCDEENGYAFVEAKYGWIAKLDEKDGQKVLTYGIGDVYQKIENYADDISIRDGRWKHSWWKCFDNC